MTKQETNLPQEDLDLDRPPFVAPGQHFLVEIV